MTRHATGLIVCLALAACGAPPQPGGVSPAGGAEPAPEEPQMPPGEEIQVCVVTPEGELREVTAVFRPEAGDTLIEGRPFREVHSAEQSQYAAGQTWFIQNLPMLTMHYEYVAFGVQRPLEPERLRLVSTYRGVPVLAEADAPGVPHVVYLPVRPGCEMQPYQVRRGFRFRWPPPWPNPSTEPEGELRFASASAASGYSCALSTGGDAYCWGEIVPQGDWPDREVFDDGEMPAAAAGGLRLAAVATGKEHSCALTTAGRVYCSGINEYGQLGDGTPRARFRPAPVAGGLRFAAITAGAAHSCALTREGWAYCWGWNDSGRLGDGTTTTRRRPTAVAGGLRFASISAGTDFTCALTREGRAYCWGGNDARHLGDSSDTERHRPTAVAGDLRFRTLSAGDRHSCAVTSEGSAFCWGANLYGKLGNEAFGGFVGMPVAVAGGLQFAAISAGDHHTCGVTADGAAYCWGRNDYGQLGDGSFDDRPAPAAVAGGHRFASMTAGDRHSCGVTLEGEVYCWGTNYFSQLGDVDGHYRETPTRVFR